MSQVGNPEYNDLADIAEEQDVAAQAKADDGVDAQIEADIAQTQSVLKEAGQIDNYALSKAEASVKSLKQMWGLLLSELLQKMGDTPENREWLAEKTNMMQTANYSTVYHAVQFTELFNYYINGQQQMDLASLFIMNDHIRGFMNYAPGVPLNLLNVVDNELAGAQDPRWTFDALPVSRLLADPSLRIPVKVETFTDIMYGYLELFKFQQQVGGENGKIVTFTATHPALRVKDNYVSTNAIYRWFETTEENVKDAWMQGRSIQKKNTDYITNPIVQDTDTSGNSTDEQPQTEEQ